MIDRQRKSTVKQTGLAAVVLAVGGAAFWLGRTSVTPNVHADETHAEEPNAPTASVQVSPLSKGSVSAVSEAYGTIQFAPGSSTDLVAPFESSIESLSVVPGQSVSRETPLVVIAATPEAKLQLKQASEAVESAQRNLEKSQQRLHDALGTNAEVDAAQQVLKAATTQFESLKGRGIGERRTLLAEADGIVSAVSVRIGQTVTTGASLVTLDFTKKLEAVVGVEPSDVARLSLDDVIDLRELQAAENAAPIEAKISRIAPVLNPQTRLREIAVALPEKQTMLPGSFVLAYIRTATGEGWVVPRSAVETSAEGASLFVVSGGKAVEKSVQVVLTGRDNVLLADEGLQEGDSIVVSGNAELEDGMSVTTQSSAIPDAEDKRPAGSAP